MEGSRYVRQHTVETQTSRLMIQLRKTRKPRTLIRSVRRSRLETLERRDLLTALVWANGPSLPAPQTDAVAVIGSDNAVHLVGGESTAAPQLSATATAWTAGENIDTARNDLGAIRSGSAILLFGGTGNDEGSDEVLNYDYRTGDSQDLAKMNQIRYDHGFAADASGRAYAFGGVGVFADGEVWSDAERYDPAVDSWTAIAPLPQPLRGMSAIGDGNGNVFVFGGSTTLNDSGIQDTNYRYDVATDAWSTVGPMLVGTRDSAVTSDADGLIYLTGGMTSTGATDAVQQYNPTTNTWVIQTPLPAPVYSHAAAFDAGGRIMVAGGFNATGTATNAVYRTQNLSVPDFAPVFSTSPITSGSLDAFYSYDVNASGNPVPIYSLVAGPVGMSIDATTGLISWQPIDGQVGDHSVVVETSNRVDAAQQAYDVTVLADTIAPTVPTSFTFDNATESSVSFTWNASDDVNGIDHYEIATANYTGPRFGKRWVYTVVDSIPGTDTTKTLASLNPLEGQNYAVRAVDGSGIVSSWSARVSATTLAAPALTFRFGTQTTGAIQNREQTPISIQLISQANPAPTFELVSGPAGIVVDSVTGAVTWTPDTPDVGAQTALFRATNSVGSADLSIDFDILADTPKLTVQFNPTTGEPFATAGILFNAQMTDSSSFPSTFELLTHPVGMTMDSSGLISWTPTAEQGGVNAVTVRGTNAGGSTDLIFGVTTSFAGAVTNVTVTGETTQLSPTVTWSAPTGEGADLVTGYDIRAYTRYRWGSHTYSYRTHIVDYTADAGSESVDLSGLLRGKTYAITITPVNAAGLSGVANSAATVTTAPELPVVRWTVNGATSTMAGVVAGKPLEIALSDQTNDPSELELVSGPTGLTFDPLTNTANWTPTAADVNVGYTSTDAVFRATNSVGPIDITVPIHVYFSGSVNSAAAFRNGYSASASWTPPTDNATPIAAYQITRSWTFAGSHKASASYTVPGDVTSISFSLIPTGAANHKGVTITPIDEFGNSGVGISRIAFGSYQNDLPPIANDDTFDATEDTQLVVNYVDGVRANDIDTDNTPGGSVLSARLVTGPTNGTLILGSTGSISYTPNDEFNGTDSFVYRVYDGRFYSENATVTINVSAVNDAPTALDDHYTLDQDMLLNSTFANGVLANDSDIDGDAIAATVVTAPTHGTVTLGNDGSFTYTPNPGFSGADNFTYVASDTLLDSRVSTVNLEIQSTVAGTKFFVVDTAVERTFEYAADGTLIDNYSLRNNNKGSQGAAASSDGSTLFVVNGNRRVFVYDDAGGYQGFWTAVGPQRVDGIATDDTDIWILDRNLDTVFHYANAAMLRSGEAEPTDSFALHANNKNGKGITTDGTHIWVVNDVRGKDKVYKYGIDGTYVSRWNIDPANAKPTGITIDPTGATNDIWIVDNQTDSVYQYNSGATRNGGSVVSNDVFALDAANTNPQGIADPESLTTDQLSVADVEQRVANTTDTRLFWDNPDNEWDVNDDGKVSAIDALLIINHLNRVQFTDVALSDFDGLFLDPNADGRVSASDALSVINGLNRLSLTSSSEIFDQAIGQLDADDEFDATLRLIAPQQLS